MTRKNEIAARLHELNDEARVLRESGEPVGEGATTHTQAVARNHVETYTMKQELANIVRKESASKHGECKEGGEFLSGQHRYRISSQRASSERLGPCEVCHQDVSDVHLQVEERFFVIEATDQHAGRHGWTQHECNSLFGHEQCLISRRRGEYVATKTSEKDGRSYAIHNPIDRSAVT